MEAQLELLKVEALAKIEAASDVKSLNEVRVAYLGKKGTNYGFVERYGETSC